MRRKSPGFHLRNPANLRLGLFRRYNLVPHPLDSLRWTVTVSFSLTRVSDLQVGRKQLSTGPHPGLSSSWRLGAGEHTLFPLLLVPAPEPLRGRDRMWRESEGGVTSRSVTGERSEGRHVMVGMNGQALRLRKRYTACPFITTISCRRLLSPDRLWPEPTVRSREHLVSLSFRRVLTTFILQQPGLAYRRERVLPHDHSHKKFIS